MSAFRRLAVLCAATVLLTGCSGDSERAEEPRPLGTAGASSLEDYYRQRPAWKDCEGGFQCARFEVPLDYAEPAGERLLIAMVRRPAGDRNRRIGSIVLNPGGPGGSGIDYARAAREVLTPQILQRFDVVGFDPRGVGESSPVRCLTGAQLDRYFGTDATPDTAAERAELARQSRDFGRACADRSGSLLPHVGTVDAARDMDVLRAVLGDQRLTYLGKSYGSYLGAYYADLFPRRVRALVLDGAVDPSGDPLELNVAQARGFEVAFRAFAADCATRADCPLGEAADPQAAARRFAELLDRADAAALRNRIDERPVNEPRVMLGVVAALYSKRTWSYLRTALREGYAGDGTVLLQLGDFLMERRPDGGYSTLAESNTAINCVDRAWPRDPAAYERSARAASRAAPLFGETIAWGSLPCATWPAGPTEQRSLTAAGARPILVLGTTRDPATPYAWARELARRLDSGVLVGYDGDGHTAYMQGSRCVDRVVDRYLIDGAAPRDATMCR